MCDTLFSDILTHMGETYGSLEDPTFSKILERMEADGYRPLIKTIQGHGQNFVETTDGNNDVSAQMALWSDDYTVAVELSYVGPFAVVREMNADGSYSWAKGALSAMSSIADHVCREVVEAGFSLVDRTTAQLPVDLALWHGEPATVYRALFTDTDVIP